MRFASSLERPGGVDRLLDRPVLAAVLTDFEGLRLRRLLLLLAAALAAWAPEVPKTPRQSARRERTARRSDIVLLFCMGFGRSPSHRIPALKTLAQGESCACLRRLASLYARGVPAVLIIGSQSRHRPRHRAAAGARRAGTSTRPCARPRTARRWSPRRRAAPCTPLQLDVTDDEQIAALDELLPERLDAVVNNAGIVVSGPLETLSADDLREQFEVNVVGAVALTNAVLPRLRASAGPDRLRLLAQRPDLDPDDRRLQRLEVRDRGDRRRLAAGAAALGDQGRPGRAGDDRHRPLAQRAGDARGRSGGDERPSTASSTASTWPGCGKTIPRIQKMAKPVDGVAAAIERALTAPRPRRATRSAPTSRSRPPSAG